MIKEKLLMNRLRTTIPFGNMKNVLSQTETIRIIKFFPRNGNQAVKKLLCYTRHNEVIFATNFTYLGLAALRQLLPNRIGLIEDYCYMAKRKDFDYYTEVSYD